MSKDILCLDLLSAEGPTPGLLQLSNCDASKLNLNRSAHTHTLSLQLPVTFPLGMAPQRFLLISRFRSHIATNSTCHPSPMTKVGGGGKDCPGLWQLCTLIRIRVGELGVNGVSLLTSLDPTRCSGQKLACSRDPALVALGDCYAFRRPWDDVCCSSLLAKYVVIKVIGRRRILFGLCFPCWSVNLVSVRPVLEQAPQPYLEKWAQVVTPSGQPPEALIKEGSSRGAPHRVASLKKWREVVAKFSPPRGGPLKHPMMNM